MRRIFTFFLFLFCALAFSVSAFADTADKSELSVLLGEIYDPSQYTVESYQTYQNAVNNALAVYENDTATQEKVNTVTEELKEAKKGLTLISNREPLLDYIEDIEELIYNTNYVLTAETIQILTSIKNDFQKLYESENLSQEQLNAAKIKYDNVIKIKENTKEVQKFSAKEADENVIIPSKIISSTQGLGRVTTIRLTLLLISFGLILLGGTASILYLKPPKFLK